MIARYIEITNSDKYLSQSDDVRGCQSFSLQLKFKMGKFCAIGKILSDTNTGLDTCTHTYIFIRSPWFKIMQISDSSGKAIPVHSQTTRSGKGHWVRTKTIIRDLMAEESQNDPDAMVNPEPYFTGPVSAPSGMNLHRNMIA